MHDVWISGLGHAMPGPAIKQQDVADWLKLRLRPGSDGERFQRFADRSGVTFRHSVLDILGGEGDHFYPKGGMSQPDMMKRSLAFSALALPLSLAAIERACPQGVGDITHIIGVTCTGAIAPGLDIQLAKALKLRGDVRRTMITFMGCYAAIPALRIAYATCQADAKARVLVVCCELSTLHLTPGPQDDLLIAALLFADGASAVVVESGDSPKGRGIRIVRESSALSPDSEDQMTWLAGAEGFVLRISPKLISTIAMDLAPLSQRLLPDGRPSNAIRWAVHPGGPRILDSVEKHLELGAGALASSREELAIGGNRSSGTVLAILERDLGQTWTGELAMIAFGPGLTADAMLVERCQ